MKKSLLSLVAFVFGISAFAGIANWLSISDIFSNGEPSVNTAYTQLLNEYSPEWWYLDGVSLTCEVDGNGVLTLTSPRIWDSIDESATSYRLFVSPYRISQIKSGEPSVDNSNIKMFEQKVESSNVSEINFKLSKNEISDAQAYYGFITPLDMYDVVWAPSKEVCFQINKNVCMFDTECNTFDLVVNPAPSEPEQNTTPETTTPTPEANPEANPEETHGSAECVSMEYANVRHTSDGKNITLTWTSVGDGDVDIAIFNPTDEVFEKIATVKMSAERYVYPMRWNGVQNFILTNECWQAKYKADEGIVEWEPEKIVTPATGPAENIMYIAIAAIILYGAYTIFFRKSDN